MWVVAVEAISVAVQVVAGAIALRLVRITGRKRAWLLITAGVWGMAARRGFSLSLMLHDGQVEPAGLVFAVLGLVTSCFMLLGVCWIAPLFEETRTAHAEAERRAQEMKLLAESLQAAIDNARILRGLLPICSSCKKIRDDQGYWHQVESYIHDRTEADFSHGICPECARKLYPEHYKEPA